MPMRRWLLILLACISAAASAHEVPSDVRVQMFVAPEAGTLQVLVRVPMAAMREVDLPLLPGGFIDLPRADAALRDAAALWITDNLELREGDRVLPAPRVAVARVSLFADRSFAQYDTALAQLRAAPIDPRELLYWKQQFLDVLLAYPIASAEGPFSIQPRFERMGLKVSTTLRYRPAGGTERAY
jgi:hypothetical protein